MTTAAVARNTAALPTFYGYYRSSASYRCRIAFNLKGFDVAYVPVHLRRGGGEQKRPDYRAINPQGLVPALEVGDVVLTQSLAIVEWLDETHPEPPLLPHDPLERAGVRAFAHAIAMDIHPLNNLRVLDQLANEYGFDKPMLDHWYFGWIAEGLAACERLLERHEDAGPFCFGASPSLADICLVPQLYNARRYGAELAPYPRLLSSDRACAGHPAFIAALPERQPDADQQLSGEETRWHRQRPDRST